MEKGACYPMLVVLPCKICGRPTREHASRRIHSEQAHSSTEDGKRGDGPTSNVVPSMAKIAIGRLSLPARLHRILVLVGQARKEMGRPVSAEVG